MATPHKINPITCGKPSRLVIIDINKITPSMNVNKTIFSLSGNVKISDILSIIINIRINELYCSQLSTI